MASPSVSARATKRQLRYVVIGGGMSGILSAIRLRDRGQEDFVVYEKRPKIGGTWYDNRYPGLYCDVPAHAYTYSFAPYTEWRSYFATGPDIREYFEYVVDKFGVRHRIKLNSEVTHCRYSDEDSRWHLTLKDGRTDAADVVIIASGVLHHPRKPDIPGLDTFKGDVHHSAEWPQDTVTAKRRIGVIGTGSTGVQLVGALIEEAEKVVHFSRTPQWILQGSQFDYTEEQISEFRKNPATIDAIRYGPEYQGFLQTYYTAVVNPESPEYQGLAQVIRQGLEDNVKDPELRERLRPDYLPMCKRLVMSWNYYDAIQRPNARLEIGKIERVEDNGIRMKDGTFHELDLIVLATGFKVDRFIRPTVVSGENGVTLDEVWAERPVAHLAISVPRFPNLFFLNGPNAPVGNFSLIEVAELQWNYLSPLLDELESGRCGAVAAKQAALDKFERERIEATKGTIFASGCKSWYLDAQGTPTGWPWNFNFFVELMKAPVFDDYAIR